MHGLLQMPQDYEARKEAYERKRTQREKQRIIAERLEEQSNTEQRRTTLSMTQRGRRTAKEQKWMSMSNQPSSMEVLAQDLKLRTWKELRVGDKALKLSGKRWLPVHVLNLIQKRIMAKLQYMWPKRDAPAKDNATED